MLIKPEEALQIDIIKFLRLARPQHIIFAIPNEGNRGTLGQQIAVAKGLLAGLHDICILAEHEHGWEPYFMEVKTAAGKISIAQRRVHALFDKLGIYQCVVRSIAEAESALSNWHI